MISEKPTGKRQDAPGELELVRAFVNTWDLEAATDELETAEQLEQWLTRNLGTRFDRGPGEDDLARGRELREALRAMLASNTGLALDRRAVAVINDAADRARLALKFDRQGTAALSAAATGVNGGFGRLLEIVAAAQSNGTWPRLKSCPADDCRWAFYDHSRNGRGVWCQMSECGNRAKGRRFRERQRGQL